VTPEEDRSTPDVDELLRSTPADSQGDAPETEGRDRRGLAAEVELSPVSLVGSYFLRLDNAEVMWWGVVVGEVQPGHYLCHVESGLEHGDAQVVMTLDRMLGHEEGYEWRFFDTEEKMKLGYAEYLARGGESR
jgi:hypothetical protein